MSHSDVVLVSTRYGKLWALRDDAYQTGSILAYGEYSPYERGVFERFVSEGHTVIDAGANQGFLTLPLAALVGATGTVHAFEPQPELFAILEKNCETQSNIIRHQQALGQRMEQSRIASLETLSKTRNNFGATHIGEGEYPIDVVTIDSLELDRLDFIKADVEGYEASLVMGGEHTIARCRPFMYLENDKPENMASLLFVVQSFEYDCYWHVAPFYSPKNFNGVTTDVFPGQYSLNMICLPRDRDFAIRNKEPIPEGLTDEHFINGRWKQTIMGLSK